MAAVRFDLRRFCPVAAGIMLALLLCPARDALAQPTPSSQAAPQQAEGEEVSAVRVTGNQAVSEGEFMRSVRTRPGRIFDPTVVQEDVRRLNATNKYLDVKTLVEQPAEGGVVVIFQVVERPTFRYVRYIGNANITGKKLSKQTELKAGMPADPYSVEEGRRKIEEFYRERGYNKVQVSIIEGNKLSDRGAVFLIHEGQSQRVWKTEFIGNQIASDGRLRTQIQSKPPILWVWKGFVDREKIDGDVERLTAYYRSLGFFRARIGRELEFNEKENWVTVTFYINEGPRYKVRNVSFVGNKRFQSSDWQEYLKLEAGHYFNQSALTKDVGLVQDYYGSQGYIFTDVQAEPRFLEEPGQLDLVYEITEGSRYRVGQIEVRIKGNNPHTRVRTVLNRLDLRPGDIVDTRKLRDAERRLKASGLFLTDPTRGAAPKVVAVPPTTDEAQTGVAGRPKRPNGFRGQSPDPDSSEQVQNIQIHGELLPEFQGATAPTAAPPAAHIQQPATGLLRQQFYREPPRPANMPRDERQYGRRPSMPTSEAPGEMIIRGQGVDGFGGRALPSPRFNRGNSPYPPPTAGYQPTPAAAQPPVYEQPFQQQQPLQQQPVQQQPGTPVEALQPLGPGDFEGEPELILPGGPQGPVDYSEPVQEAPYLEPDQFANILAEAEETETGKLLFGVGINSDAGVVGSIVLDEQNFDIWRPPTSWEDIRTATAFRGAGQQLRIEAVPGTQVQRYMINFREPYFLDTPVSFGISGFYYDRRFRDFDENRIGGRISFGYQITPDLSATVALRGESIKISDPREPTPPELAEVVGDNELYTVRAALAHDTRDSAFLPTEGHLVEFAFEQGFGDFTFPKGTVEVRQYFLLHERPDSSGRHVLSVSGQLGFTGEDTPLFERFFAGGYSTLRGFDFRGASPRNMNVIVGGDFQALGSVEYMYPITAGDAIRGVVFCDFGTVEDRPRLDEDTFRVSPGAGLRITVPGLGPAPIAVDLAVPIARADGDDIENFSFFVGLLR